MKLLEGLPEQPELRDFVLQREPDPRVTVKPISVQELFTPDEWEELVRDYKGDNLERQIQIPTGQAISLLAIDRKDFAKNPSIIEKCRLRLAGNINYFLFKNLSVELGRRTTDGYRQYDELLSQLLFEKICFSNDYQKRAQEPDFWEAVFQVYELSGDFPYQLASLKLLSPARFQEKATFSLYQSAEKVFQELEEKELRRCDADNNLSNLIFLAIIQPDMLSQLKAWPVIYEQALEEIRVISREEGKPTPKALSIACQLAILTHELEITETTVCLVSKTETISSLPAEPLPEVPKYRRD